MTKLTLTSQQRDVKSILVKPQSFSLIGNSPLSVPTPCEATSTHTHRDFYRRQQICGKVMFSQASVDHSVHAGGAGVGRLHTSWDRSHGMVPLACSLEDLPSSPTGTNI